MVPYSFRAQPGHVFCALLPPRVPFLGLVAPLAASGFPAILLPLKKAPPLSSPENPVPAALRNDEIAAFPRAPRHAQSRAAGRFAKCERRAGRTSALRCRANATGPVIPPLRGHESARSRGFAIPLRCHVPDRWQPIPLHGHTTAKTIPLDHVRSVVSPISRPARAGNACRYAHIPSFSRRADVMPSSLFASLWPARSQNTSLPALRS